MKKGFTLIELLAVIVVLAILALVVTPVVLNIVDKAQMGSDERSLEQYAKLMQTSYYEEKIKDTNLTLASYLENVDTKYSSAVSLTYNGSKVECKTKRVITTSSGPTSIELYGCKVGGRGLYMFVDGKVEKIEEPKSFEEDLWSTIISNVRIENTSKYKVGDTKQIDLGMFGVHTVRISNMSNPIECKALGFSQTACGFVIEFADIIIDKQMNSTWTNVGGWPKSELYTYATNDIYNALPEDLKRFIIDTYVVSGHGEKDLPNKESIDKLYLLSTTEVWNQEISNQIGNDESKNVTRQLDYYSNLGVTTNNFSAAVKQYNGSSSGWWLRSAHSGSSGFFYYVAGEGPYGNDDAFYSHGVSPAFRIG